jgi:ribosomal protein S18 acetylase RimI-like enzyme
MVLAKPDKMPGIQKSHRTYKKEFSEMIIASANYFTWLFGKKIKIVLEKLYVRKNNLFSYEHCYIVKKDDKIASMVLCYDYLTKKQENLNTGWLLFRFLNFNILKRLPVLLEMNKTIGQLSEGDFYISNIATFENFRRKGIAKKLLLECEKIALNKNTKRMVLDVEKENIPAISLYESLGYIISDRYHINSKKVDLNFFRMTKSLV